MNHYTVVNQFFSLDGVAESKQLLGEGCCCLQSFMLVYCFFMLQLWSLHFLVTFAYFNNS